MIKETTGERLCIDTTTAWESEEEAEDALNYAGWQEMESGRVYCDDCLDNGGIIFGESNNEDDYDN